MHVLSTVVLLAFLSAQFVTSQKLVQFEAPLSVDAFIQKQLPIAIEQVYCNIGTQGCNTLRAGLGVILSFPSPDYEDHEFTWTRDSALTIKMLMERFNWEYDPFVQQTIQQYIAVQVTITRRGNLSGGLIDGRGLAEPKHAWNTEPYKGEIGRPQRDGPALRAIAIMAYGDWLVRNGYFVTAKQVIWPLVRNDLEYVAQYWNQTGYDLWGERKGSSFWTLANQHRALVQGGQFANQLNETGSRYTDIAPAVKCFMQTFWNRAEAFIMSTQNLKTSRSGKDVNTILAVIHSFDPKLECDPITFQPCSDVALANHKTVVEVFRRYKINRHVDWGKAIAVGRFPEDKNEGGNAWYIATLAAAEQLYDSLYVWNKTGVVEVTPTSLDFFMDLLAWVEPGRYERGSDNYRHIMNSVAAYADDFVAVVQRHMGIHGNMSAQFNSRDGRPWSYKDWTWSYVSFITTARRRKGLQPPSWSSPNVTNLLGPCVAKSVVGTYYTPSVTWFPPNQTPRSKRGSDPFAAAATTTVLAGSRSSETTAVATCVVKEPSVKFELLAEAKYGEIVKITGNTTVLRRWSQAKAIHLDPHEYTSEIPLWDRVLKMHAGEVIGYKYIKVNGFGSVTLEQVPIRTYIIPQSCEPTVTIRDSWQNQPAETI